MKGTQRIWTGIGDGQVHTAAMARRLAADRLMQRPGTQGRKGSKEAELAAVWNQ
jgi:hypothetical protein